MKSSEKQFTYFFFRSELFFRTIRKRPAIVQLWMISIIIQTLLASVPAIVSSIPRNSGFYLGLMIIVSSSILLRTVASAVLLQLFVGVAGGSGRRPSFCEMMSISLYCQMILLAGKTAAVCISLLQFSLGIMDRFSVIRFIDLAKLTEQFGWTVPEAIGRADAFSVLFVVVLVRVIRSETDIPVSAAAVGAVANWFLIGAVQRTVIELPNLIWG